MKRELTEKDICPSCRKAFDCSRSNRCWCFEQDVGPEILANIEKDYEACLCPECLKKFENQQKGQRH